MKQLNVGIDDARQRAELAWAAYTALLRAQASDPGLRANPYWTALRDTAHARFRATYEAVG